MVNGLKFPSRVATLKPRGTLERSRSGYVDWPLKGVGDLKNRRDLTRSVRGNPSATSVESTGKKSFRGSCKTSVPETDTGG